MKSIQALVSDYRTAIQNGQCIRMNRNKRRVDPEGTIYQVDMPARHAAAAQCALLLSSRRKWLSSGNPKLRKANGALWLNTGFTLSPAEEAKPILMGTRFANHNSCSHAVTACILACVGSVTGQGRLATSKIARIGKLLALLLYRKQALDLMTAEILKAQRKAERKGAKLAIRANVATDLPWLAATLAKRCPGVSFYDYTAIPQALKRPDGVRRILSLKGQSNMPAVRDALASGHGVAVVFDIGKYDPKPATWEGAPVIDGDLDDIWFDRAPEGAFVVGLSLKGNNDQQAQARTAGFAVAC